MTTQVSERILIEAATPINLSNKKSASLSSSSLNSSSSSLPSRKALATNDLLIGLVLSRWDNILGPQCIYLWTEERTSCFNPGSLPSHLDSLVKYVTDHTVDHHDIIVDGYLLTPATCRHSLCLVHELNLAYLSISIRVPSDPTFYYNNNNYYGGGGSSSSTVTGGDYNNSNYIGGESSTSPSTVPHAISILVNLSLLKHFLLMRPIVLNWLAEFGPKLSILLCKNQLQSSMINSWCAELCKTMSTVRTCWWQNERSFYKESGSIDFVHQNGEKRDYNSKEASSAKQKTRNKTHISIPHNKANKRKKRRRKYSSKNFDQSQHWDFLPPPWPNKTSFESILTSHLSTSGCSIIVGNDAHNMNQVIRFLLCFARGDEGYCSRYVHPALPDTFMKGLFVQGLMIGEIGERSLSLYQVSSNRYPMTHIELKHKSSLNVKQSPHIQLHQQRREIILIQELVNLWNWVPFVHPVLEPFPKHVRDITTKAVTKFLNDLLLLDPETRYGRLILFKRLIHSKAMSLVTYLNSITHKPVKMRSQLIKDLKETLRLDENEFVIVQVHAEKLRPGVLAQLRC